MNLSVKLITVLAAFVLLVVGLVGLTMSGSSASAADVDGKVYVANEWSKLTNDPTPLATYKYAGSGKTIYSTFKEVNDVTGIVQNTIQGSSDVVTIFVEDADVNVALPKTKAVTGNLVGNGIAANVTQIVVLAANKSPIVDADSDGLVSDDVTVTSIPANAIAITGATPGATGISGTVSLINTQLATVTSVILSWNTSSINTVIVKVATTQNTVGKTFTINETGASTGVFKGSITLKDIQHLAPISTEIQIQNAGIVTVSYVDATPAGSAATKTITSSATAETNAPVLTLTSPANGSATQVLRPAFAGSVTDTTAGLDVSNILVFIDKDDDKADGTPVAAGLLASVDVNTPTKPAGTVDGATSATFTLTPAVNLPALFGGTTPDHVVDWQVQATDLAGNVGWSDAKTSGAGSANVSSSAGAGIGKQGRGQVNTVKIDRTLPGITNAYTGFVLDNTGALPVRKVNNKSSIEIYFNDDIDSATIQNTDFEVVVGTVTQVPTAAVVGGTGFKSSVFLTIDTALATKDKPTVRIVGSIADAAGNTTSTGSKVAKDALAPTITVALSGGSSATAPATLTKLAMSITITSDENLSADPTVAIYDELDAANIEGSVTAVNQGGNIWKASFSGGSFGGGGNANLDGEKKSIVVTANDATSLVVAIANSITTVDTLVVPTGTVIGQAVKGKADDKATGAILFTLDKTAPTITLSPTGTTSDGSPFVRWNFGEVVTVSKAEFGLSSATLTDVTTELGTGDNKTFIRATSSLALGLYKATATVTDLAGNKATGLNATFTIAKRADWKLTILPGTTLMSFPLTPSDTSINVVFSPVGIVSVSSYDTATGSFSSSVRDAESGDLAGSLASVESGVGYIVVADAVAALVVPIPALSASSIPPSIAIAAGWNLVGVTDVTGSNTGDIRQPGSSISQTSTQYFPAKVTSVYDWDATGKVWKAVLAADNVLVGDAYWAFATAADVLVP